MNIFFVDKILFMENNIKQKFCRGWFMQTCNMMQLFCINCHRKWCMVHVINLLLLLNFFKGIKSIRQAHSHSQIAHKMRILALTLYLLNKGK